MRHIFLFFSFLIFTNSFASELDVKIPQSRCSDIDIRNNMNSEMREYFSKPKNQDGIGWCYAFVAADLISVEVGRPISATHISAIFNKNIDNSIFMKLVFDASRLFSNDNAFEGTYEGGWIDKAIKQSVKERNICLEKDLPFDGNYYGETQEIIQGLEEIKRHISRGGDITNTCNMISNIKENFFLNSEVRDIYVILEQQNINQALASLIKINCKESLELLPELKVVTIYPPRLRRFGTNDHGPNKQQLKREAQKKLLAYYNKIDDSLKTGKPMGISYNVENIMDSDSGHASVVVARRWKNNKCQFKIRNSLGSTCGSYDDEKIEECNYEEGSYWVSDQKFYDMAYSINYISK